MDCLRQQFLALCCFCIERLQNANGSIHRVWRACEREHVASLVSFYLQALFDLGYVGVELAAKGSQAPDIGRLKRYALASNRGNGGLCFQKTLTALQLLSP